MENKQSKQQFSRAQEKAKSFMEVHSIEKIISEMLNSLVHSRDDKPIVFMIKYLSALVTESDLFENGISVKGPIPQRVPIITYPKFEPDCNSLLKKHLTRENWGNLKKKQTGLGGSIQLCIKNGAHNQQSKVGVMATDDEAYKTFNDLFGPIIKDLHPKYDHRISYRYDAIAPNLLDSMGLDNKIDKISDFKFEAYRNFKQTPFSPLMTKEARLQVERKVVEVLGDLFGNYYQISKLNNTEKEWLNSIGIDPDNKNKDHDAGGVNDDWPVGRGVFIQDNKEFIVMVNFEDHLRFVILKGDQIEYANDNQVAFNQGVDRLIKILQRFEKLAYANDPYLGNLTVDPQKIGTAMKLWCTIKGLENKTLPEEFEQSLLDNKYIMYKKEKDSHTFTTQTTLAANYNEVQMFTDFRTQIGQAQELLMN